VFILYRKINLTIKYKDDKIKRNDKSKPTMKKILNTSSI